jgi:hypothetical protein
LATGVKRYGTSIVTGVVIVGVPTKLQPDGLFMRTASMPLLAPATVMRYSVSAAASTAGSQTPPYRTSQAAVSYSPSGLNGQSVPMPTNVSPGV